MPEGTARCSLLIGSDADHDAHDDAADDDAAFHFEGTELREVVSQREGAGGYSVSVDGEQPLDVRVL